MNFILVVHDLLGILDHGLTEGPRIAYGGTENHTAIINVPAKFADLIMGKFGVAFTGNVKDFGGPMRIKGTLGGPTVMSLRLLVLPIRFCCWIVA